VLWLPVGLVVAACGTTTTRATVHRPATGSSAADEPGSTKRAATARHDRRRPRGAAVALRRVVDGDTIVVSSGAYVRFLQIDTPELASDECYATQARAALERLLPSGSRLRLVRDPELDRADRYGRLLRYVYRGRTNVNLAMVRRGAAAPYFYRGDRGRFSNRLLALAVAAKRAHRGLWGACPGTRLEADAAVSSGAAGAAGGGGAGSGGCEPGYSPCLPIAGDLDCADIPDSEKPVRVTGSDPYRLDGNGDGLGCT
jgi:endonuclease YncB( thermonuclease family)